MSQGDRDVDPELTTLRTRLEETEDLLGRAVIDSDAFALGRQDGISYAVRVLDEEAKHLLTLRDGCPHNSDEWHRFHRAWAYLVQVQAALGHKAGGVMAPLPPERLRARIEELEIAFEPFVKPGGFFSGRAERNEARRVWEAKLS